MIFDELFFQKLNRIKVNSGNIYIHFYNYMDRLWGEVGNEGTGEIMYETQVTCYSELYSCCEFFCDFTKSMDTYQFLGVIVEKLFETRRKF